tara:strand:- start:6758 stop:8227 length:1470 start_codon:yes stop_codon:yes gene_type:complete
MARYVLFTLFLSLAISNFLLGATVGDAILKSREAEMSSLQDKFSPLSERQISSSLSNVSRIDDSIQLVDPKEGIPSFTLLETVKRVIANNKILKNYSLIIKTAQDNVYAVSNSQKFNIDMDMGLGKAGNFGDDSRDQFHRHLFDLSNLEDSFHIGLDVNFSLLDGGRSAGKTKVAKLKTELSKIEELKFRQNLLEKTTNLFVDLILIQEKLDIAAMRVEIARNGLNYEETKPSRDSRMPVPILNAKLQLEKALQDEFVLRNKIRHKKAKFRNLVGLDRSTNFGLDKDAKTKTINDSLQAFQKIAEKNSLQLKIIRLEQAEARYNQKIIKSEQLPFVDLHANTHYARLADRSDLDELRFKFGVKFDMNLFNGKTTGSKLKANGRQKDIKKNKYEDALLEVRNQVSLYYSLFSDLKVRIPVVQNNLKLARSILYEAEDRFQKKQLSKDKLLENRINFKKSLLRYYEVLGSLINAKLKLFAVSGQLNESIFG